MSKEDMIKEAVEEAKAEAAKMEDEAAADEQDEAAETKGSVEEEASKETEESQDTKDTESKEKKKFFAKKEKKDKKDEKIEELTDRLTRQMAEFDNFRKRTEKEKASMYEIGARDIIEKILPVLDNFERGLAAVPEDVKGSSFAEGVEMIYKQFVKTLEDAGVEAIEAVGQQFDPNIHNAVMHIDDENFGENEISQELLKGYKYRGTVVRHSMVQVAN